MFSAMPIFSTIRADMGNAEIPAAPTMGLILVRLKILRILANTTPAMVSKIKATRPRAIIMMVCTVTNWSARMEKAMVMPSSSVMRLAKSFWAVSDRRLSTPHSRMRLPNIRKPTRETEAGATRPATKVTMMGNRMRVVLVTALGRYSILMARSFLVVTSLMAAGWMMGTRAM